MTTHSVLELVRNLKDSCSVDLKTMSEEELDIHAGTVQQDIVILIAIIRRDEEAQRQHERRIRDAMGCFTRT